MGSLINIIREQLVMVLLEEAHRRRTSHLNLSNFHIGVIPKNLFSLKHLKKLNINSNEINDLSGISGLKKLTSLALDYNKVEKIPKEIKYLGSHLTRLNISYNPLLKVPREIGKLRSLTVLWLNHCQLSELPPELGKLHVLDTFGARGNCISVIPKEFCKLTFLRWLTLEDNLIEELPMNFKELAALKHLNLEKNHIKVIPEALKHLRDLKYCFLGKNKIKKVSKELLKEVRHILKLDLHGNKDLRVTAEMKLPNIATEMLGSSSEVIPEEEWEDVSEGTNEWVRGEEESDDEKDWEESLPSSELDLSELSDLEDFEQADMDRTMDIPETIANAIPQISLYVVNGF